MAFEELARADIQASTAFPPMLGSLDEAAAEEIVDSVTRLLLDVWMSGQFAGVVDPKEWPALGLPRLCLQVVAASNLGEAFRDDLDDLG